MPPEIDGTDIRDKMGSMRDYVQAMNEMAMANQAGYSSLSLMLETMHKSHYSFTEFMSILERTNVVLYSSARLVNELGQNIKGAVNSVEGLISAFGMLGGKVMPELVHTMGMSIKNAELNVDAMRNEAKILQENIAHRTKSINMGNQESEIVKELIVVRGKEQERLKMLKEDIDDASLTMERFGESMTKALGVVTLMIATAISVAQAYDTAVKAKREVIFTLERMGASYGKNKEAMDRFDKDFTAISSRWGMLREEMAKAVAPLSALGVGGAGTLKEAADIMGGMFKGFGIDMGTTVRALGTFATSLNLEGKALGDTFREIAGHGDKNVLGMQRYIVEMTTAMETTRRFGGAAEGSMLMLDSFGAEIRKGTITMSDVTRMISPAMWSLPQQGAVASMMGRYAPEEARKIGLTGGNVLDDILALQRAAGDDKKSQVLAAGMGKLVTGLAGGGTEGEQAVKAQLLLQQLTGVQVPLLDAVKTLTDPEKLSKAMAGGAKPLSKSDMAENFKYTATIAEQLTFITEDVRNIVLLLGGEGVRKDPLTKATGGMIEWISKYLTERHADYTPEGRAKEAGWKEPKKKATGGYIPETAMYMLHAGESVSRPGETGGGVSISLGGLNINVAGQGDLRGQLDEAFDRMKRETLREVENQWNQSLAAH